MEFKRGLLRARSQGCAARRRAGSARRAGGGPARRNPECRPPVPSDERPAAEGEEGEEKARRREGDRQAEDDLDQPAESARGIAEGKAQAGDDDDDHRDDLGDRTLDALEDRLEWSSEERRGGKECVSSLSSWWTPFL